MELYTPDFGHAYLINGFLKIETCYSLCSIFKHAVSILTSLWLGKCKACTDAAFPLDMQCLYLCGAMSRVTGKVPLKHHTPLLP